MNQEVFKQSRKTVELSQNVDLEIPVDFFNKFLAK